MDDTPIRYWCDLQPGEQFNSEPLTLSREDILAFASEFDPQPYHLDAKAAEDSLFGGLCASGWQVAAMMMRLLSDCLHQHNIPVQGIEAVPKLQWKRPVYENDSLHAQFCITHTLAESRRKRCGRIQVDVLVLNQDNTLVTELSATLLVQHKEDA